LKELLKEADRLHLMRLVEKKKLTLKKTSMQLNLSLRQTLKIWGSFKTDEPKGLISKRRGHCAPNKISNEIREKMTQNLHYKYIDFGPTLTAKKLAENENIHVSRESLRQIMIAEGIWKQKKR